MSTTRAVYKVELFSAEDAEAFLDVMNEAEEDGRIEHFQITDQGLRNAAGDLQLDWEDES